MPLFSPIMPFNNPWKCPNLHLKKYLILQVTIDFIKTEPHCPLKTTNYPSLFFHYISRNGPTKHITTTTTTTPYSNIGVSK